MPLSVLLLAQFALLQTVLPAAAETQRLIRKDNQARVTRQLAMMGTVVDFMLVSKKTRQANAAIDLAITEMQRIEALLTDWQDSGEIAAINQLAAERPVQVSEETFRLLEQAQNIAELSAGKFDISYAAAGGLWDFTTERIPIAQAIRKALQNVDYRALILDSEQQSVAFAKPGMRIGLGGIAKGYAVDRAVQVIKAEGYTDFAINAGGDLAIVGRKQDRLWWVGIQHPRRPDELIAVLPASNLSIATSGDYERYFISGGKRYAHIIDPHSGYPAEQCQSVTIIAPRTFFADAMATAVFVLGPEKGMQLIERQPQVQGLIIDQEGRLHYSSGLPHSNYLSE
ncbi:MAG: FAD:protein FMN transferase [Pseudomonadales bacterium]